ncbi:alpha/beta hydrolase fold domain-containing protein [Leifsonia sp. NPDC056665]|uniref:alpha/beta hydrolase fold domain-containing protein n=1 Tax=Leifsonia sp. NPDC056665 TaxID=3345901 RepID=UPI0036BBFFAD
MPLDPYLASKLHLMENMNFHQMDEDMIARMTEFYQDSEPWRLPASLDIVDASIPGPHGPVPYRRYVPESPTGTALVWAHGGGFATGDLDMLEAHLVAAELAVRAQAIVFSVDYRLAQNDVRYPVPVDDVHAVLIAALQGEVETPKPLSKVAIGGASAGAALALAAALRAKSDGAPAVSAILLAYPLAHFPSPGLSTEISAELAVLPESLRIPAGNVEWMVQNYLGRITCVPADAIPGAAQLAGLPPVSVVAAEYDDLRASAELLDRQLEASAVPVRFYLAAGMVHGYLNRSTSLSEVVKSLDFFAEALNG